MMNRGLTALLKSTRLSRGMQRWLSGYANWYAKRNRRSGHLFQGRYQSYLVEDDSYFWMLSRYIHLNLYRRFVLERLTTTVDNPLKSALREWVVGSEDFLRRMVALAEDADKSKRGRITRRMRTYTIGEIINVVAAAHGVETSEYVGFRSSAAGREMAAMLCRRYTGSTLAELSEAIGLGHPDSSANWCDEQSCAKRSRPIANAA
jgi:putative transposase